MTAGIINLPTPAASEQAESALRVLSEIRGKKRTLVFRSDHADNDTSVSMPPAAFELLLEILGQMANGNAVTIVPVNAELTTQQAADILNVSRPFLVKLLDEGKLPCRKVGTHRRVRVADIVAYKRADDEYRQKVLGELTAEAEKLGLGY